jgi:hypothetical protein
MILGEDNPYPTIDIHALARSVAPGRLRVWLGVFDHIAPSSVSWTIQHTVRDEDEHRIDVDVETVRELTAMPPGPPQVTTQSGVYDLVLPAGRAGEDPRPLHRVQARAQWDDGREVESAWLTVRPLPREVPTGLGASFKVMLVSCFYENADSAGRAGALAQMLARGLDRPDLVLTVGDQVYLDVPPWGSAKVTEASFARLFEQKYRKNWQSQPGATGYADILRAAPVAGIPDDHEYWNNYPANLWPSTWMRISRDNWRSAARNAYDAYQHGGDPTDPDSYCYTFDVSPLSFFMLDNRTFRGGTLRSMRSMRDRDLSAYEAWVQRILQTPGSVPVLVTGPSLFQAPKTKSLRKDLNFANVEEYPVIMDGLLRLSRAGRAPLALTGDVHYPRTVQATYRPGSRSRPWAPIYEVIASPASLVMGAPQGPSKPEKTDRFLLDTQVKTSLDCTKKWPPTGHPLVHDHVAILTFTRLATGLKLSVRYWLVPHSGAAPRFFTAPTMDLLHAAEAATPSGADSSESDTPIASESAPDPAPTSPIR